MQNMAITFKLLKHSFLENILLLPISRNSLQTQSSDDILAEILRSQIQFERFLTDHYAGYTWNENISVM